MGEGREGDWECGGCSNRNYAFRSFCNRCKQPRLLVDTKTPADSKWLPRIGDWVCSGCSNNNYASRDKCKKCGQPKEVAAIAMPGASLQAYAHYFARAHGAPGPKMNMGTMGNSSFQQSLPLNSNWSLGVADKYGHQSSSSWPISGSNNAGVSYGNNANQVAIPNGWRSGDWICKCGFHNYSSRQECKKCNASLSSAHGTKRLASDEILGEWDNKRLHAGDINHNFLTHSHQNSYHSFDQTGGFNNGQSSGVYPYPSGSSGMALNPQVHIQLPQIATLPTLLGKGAKQWRDGDWMCTNCNNHNYASREECNRCKTQKEIAKLPVDVS